MEISVQLRKEAGSSTSKWGWISVLNSRTRAGEWFRAVRSSKQGQPEQ